MHSFAMSRENWRLRTTRSLERAPDEVLIQIRRVGICGTDFHIYEGSHPYLAISPGHGT